MKIRGNTVVTPAPRDVYNAEYDAYTFALKCDFNELLTAFNAKKIVTLSTITPDGGNVRYYCVNYYPPELNAYGEDLLRFMRLGDGIVETIHVTKDGLTCFYNYSINTMETDIAKLKNDMGDIEPALAKKLDKFVGTGKTQLYGVNTNGEQQMYTCATGVYVSTIALRGTGGTIEVGTPTKNAHAATKKYVDDLARGLTKNLTYAPSASDVGDFIGQIWIHNSKMDGTTAGVYMYTGENHEGNQWAKIV